MSRVVLMAWCVVWGVLVGRSLVRFVRLLCRHVALPAPDGAP